MNPTVIEYVLAGVLTLMVFSYLLGNNPLYRLALHIFVGVSVGYASLLLVGNVLLPQIVGLFAHSGTEAGWLIGLPLLFGLFLLFRLVRPATRPGGPRPPATFRGLVALGTIALNIAVSTAAALAVGGALTGTIIPQVADTMRPITGDIAPLVGNLVLVLGVAASLYYFQFTVAQSGGRTAAGARVATAGRWLIVAGLGATLGSLTVSFVSALVERVDFLFHLPF